MFEGVRNFFGHGAHADRENETMPDEVAEALDTRPQAEVVELPHDEEVADESDDEMADENDDEKVTDALA